MSVYLEKQKELDSQIAKLHLEILELKRVRNKLSPVALLPTDIMAIIFSFTLATEFHRQGWGAGRLPDQVELSHVSHAWREIVLNTPSLWTLMKIRANTKAELLQRQTIHSKNAPLTIDYYCEDPNASPDLDGFSAIVCSIVGKRLKSLNVFARDLDVLRLLEGANERAEELEEVEIHDLMVHTSYAGGNLPEHIFAGQTPKLRLLKLYNYILPWTSTILASPNLTNLQLGSLSHKGTCGMTLQYISQFLNLL